MRPTRDSFLGRMTPSRIVAVTVLGSIPVRLLSERLSDPDLWWHLRTGQLIVATHRIPTADPYSYTAFGKPWIVQEWGSELILCGLRHAFGLWGILAFRAVALFIVYAIMARLLVRRMGSGMGTWALLGLTAYAGANNWTERPNLLSFILFAVMLTWLERRDTRIWWFVPTTAVWANLHGMVIVGVGTVALVAAAEWLTVWLRRPEADRTWARRVTQVACASAVAMLVNPYGPRLVVHVFTLVKVVRSLVTEWASPDFHEVGVLVFGVLLLVTIAALALSKSRASITDVALALAFTFLALQAVRNLAMSAMVLGMVAAGAMPGAIETLRARPSPRREVSTGSSSLLNAMGLTLALGGLAIVLVARTPRSNTFKQMVAQRYPVSAVDALNVPGVRVFTLDFFSGLVIERAWPNAHVYSDLRTDFYGLALSRRYQRTIAGLPGALGNLDDACTTHVLIRQKDGLAPQLEASQDWLVVRRDVKSVIFERRMPAPGCAAYPIPHLA